MLLKVNETLTALAKQRDALLNKVLSSKHDKTSTLQSICQSFIVDERRNARQYKKEATVTVADGNIDALTSAKKFYFLDDVAVDNLLAVQEVNEFIFSALSYLSKNIVITRSQLKPSTNKSKLRLFQKLFDGSRLLTDGLLKASFARLFGTMIYVCFSHDYSVIFEVDSENSNNVEFIYKTDYKLISFLYVDQYNTKRVIAATRCGFILVFDKNYSDYPIQTINTYSYGKIIHLAREDEKLLCIIENGKMLYYDFNIVMNLISEKQISGILLNDKIYCYVDLGADQYIGTSQKGILVKSAISESFIMDKNSELMRLYGIKDIIVSKDKNKMLAITFQTVLFYYSKKTNWKQILVTETIGIHAAAWSCRNSNIFATGTLNGLLAIWDSEKSVLTPVQKEKLDSSITSLAFNENDGLLVFLSNGDILKYELGSLS